MAAIYGKDNPCSDYIRSGLVESMVLMTVYGDWATQITFPQAFADNVIKKIFSNAKEWELWS
jgi:hypothetical protein